MWEEKEDSLWIHILNSLMFFHFPNEIHDKCQHVQTWCMSKQNKSMSYRKFGLFICCISDISCWDPLKSCGIFPWWDTILELGLKFIMPYQKWLWGGSDTQGMIGYITAGCGCWTNAPITMREKCPNMELFLVRIFLYSDWIRRDTYTSPYTVRIQENTDRK